MSRKSSQKRTTKVAVGPPTYVPRDFPGDQPAVQIIFRGLLSLAFNGSTSCEVGVFNGTHTNPNHPQPHDLNFRIWHRTPGACGKPEQVDIANFTNITIDAINPVFPGVFGYQRGLFDRRNPSSSPDHNVPFDFRWVMDLEGPDFYGRRLVKNSALLRPSITVKHGLFYTFYKTRSIFKRALNFLDPSPLQLRSVAEIVGVNIYLNDTGKVRITVDKVGGGTVTKDLDKTAGVIHQVDLLNDCSSGPGKCLFNEFDPSHKENRNDFYLNFDSFRRDAGEPEYELIILQKVQGDDFVVPCPPSVPTTTDPAPCSPILFGQSTNLDP